MDQNEMPAQPRDYRKIGEVFAKVSALFGGLTLAVVAANAVVKKAGEVEPEEYDQDPDTVDLVEEDEAPAEA